MGPKPLHSPRREHGVSVGYRSDGTHTCQPANPWRSPSDRQLCLFTQTFHPSEHSFWNENPFQGKESHHWARPGAQDRAGTLTSWLLRNISVWAGSICTEMSHVWAGSLGFCSRSLHSWSLCLSWESLGQSRRVTGQRGPGTTNYLCTPGRTGEGTPFSQEPPSRLPADCWRT